MLRLLSSFSAPSLAILVGFLVPHLHAVEISESTFEGRAQFLIRTEHAVWYFDRAGGGFSRLIDADGRDWISFSKTPLKQYPDSAAAGYRGIPNPLFGGSNPDAGGGHPGFDQCETIQVDQATLRTQTKSKKWQWSWHFTEQHATFTMEKVDPDHPWWFLYEGPIAGSFAPSNKFWATDTIELSTQIPSNRDQLFGQWRWVYFGDRRTPRVLYLKQHQADALPDTLWYLGSSRGGSPAAKEGMMVFGFGRGPSTKPQFTQENVSITIGFCPVQPSTDGAPLSEADTEKLRDQIERMTLNKQEIPSQASAIQIWHGKHQVFGTLGRPQRWVNVLGKVTSSGNIQSLSYQVDKRPSQPLSWGSDLHRLARAGDFNVELPYADLAPGKHQIKVEGRFQDGSRATAHSEIVIQPPTQWPLPYRVDFREVDKIQDAVQVVDGHWQLTDAGIRTKERWYDRVLSIGDTTWTNYDARVRLTLHDFTPSQRSAPTYNVTHFGVALRWRGHTADGKQPSRRWYPLGAQGEFLIKNDLTQNQWRILHNGGPGWKPSYGEARHAIQLNQAFWVRAQVQTLDDGRSRYRFKQWNATVREPDNWAVESTEPAETDYPSGALCLVPHNSDVTIHDVTITPTQ